MNLAKVVHFDSVRAHRWLLTVAEPDRKLYAYLRDEGVDINHVINLLDGMIAIVAGTFTRFTGPTEDAIALPVFEADGNPLDVVVFSMADPRRFRTMLGLGAVLGLDQVMNPATYAGDMPCQLTRTPLGWLKAGIVGHAVVLDPDRARPLLKAAPGNMAAEDRRHVRDLLRSGAVESNRLMVPVSEAAS
jgi:hypothetical protein